MQISLSCISYFCIFAKNLKHMRKIILLVLLFTISTITSAQSSSNSTKELRDRIAQTANKFLTVKGIELKPGLTMVELLHALESKGLERSDYFNYVKEKFDGYDLTGTFFNHRNCSIRLLPTNNNKKIVGVVGIKFPELNSFKELSNEYYRLKDALKDKYHIAYCKESFDSEYVNNSTSDFVKLRALSQDEGLFETRFHVSDEEFSLLLGYIVLKITSVTVNYETSYYVSLSYVTSDDTVDQLMSADDDL